MDASTIIAFVALVLAWVVLAVHYFMARTPKMAQPHASGITDMEEVTRVGQYAWDAFVPFPEDTFTEAPHVQAQVQRAGKTAGRDYMYTVGIRNVTADGFLVSVGRLGEVSTGPVQGDDTWAIHWTAIANGSDDG